MTALACLSGIEAMVLDARGRCYAKRRRQGQDEVRHHSVARMTARRLLAVVMVAHIASSSAQVQYFEVLTYRDPTQCERHECASVRSEYCRIHKTGFYLREKGCPAGQQCTNCEYGNTTDPTRCKCENPPFSIGVLYGQECNMGQVCGKGEGSCFRPCDTYLHISFCQDTYHCRWNTSTYKCEDKPPAMPLVVWANIADANPYAQGVDILANMGSSLFPQDFADFQKSAQGYTLRGLLIQDIIKMESMFLQLDENNDGMLSAKEYARLPNTLAALDAAALALAASSSSSSTGGRRLADEEFKEYVSEFERGLQAQSSTSTTTITTTTTIPTLAPATAVRPEACGAMMPANYYCSFDQSCKADCKECGWKSAADTAFYQCVRPDALTCHADGSQEFCPTDQACKPNGDCSDCLDRQIVDHASHTCLAVWWKPTPSRQWTDWVCRDRNKVGMPCRADQDCIYGMKKCLGGKCQPLQPYNANLTCESDFDCPHLGFWCQADPTGGENIYWVQYCRRQKPIDATCKEDRECVPNTLCNTAESQPRCRRYFSQDIGVAAKEDVLCELGWRDKLGKCAAPARSKEVGRPCDSDQDCNTTDSTGRTGTCACKAWWDQDDSKYCKPVTGDYEKHWKVMRDYIAFRTSNCGSFWTEEECLRIFGDAVVQLKLKVLCEEQKLSGGPYLPPADCGVDPKDKRFPDYCADHAASYFEQPR